MTHEEPITVHTFDEHNWPEFTVEAQVLPDTSSHVVLKCSDPDCAWLKRYSWPVQWSVLTTATVRHGMSHQEEQR